MRTLKKTLCLILVLSMMVGLCAFGAFATEFKDDAEIKHNEAVTVLSGMGIIVGEPDGNFNPTGTLTRAQAACILVRAMGLDDIIADPSFTDLAGYGWAKNAIAVCEAEGIVQGIGDGKFDPAGKLTGSAWGKMLLKAIGYDDADLDNGSKWEIAVAKGVKATGLKDNLDSFDGTAPISRDDACQMAFDGLWYSPAGISNEYIVKDGTGAVVYRGTDALTALVLKEGTTGSSITLGETSDGSLGNDNFGLRRETTTDAFGRESTVYTNGKTPGTAAYKEYGSIGTEPVKTYTTATKAGKIAADQGATAAKAIKLSVVDNGSSIAAKNVYKTDATVYGIDGSTIEVYRVSGGYKAIVIDYYAHKLSATDVVAAKAATATTDAQKAKIKLNGSDEFETDAFKAGDVVLYTKTKAGEVITAVKAEAFTGAITATNAGEGYLKVDGNTYTLSGNIQVSTAVGVDNKAAPAIGTGVLASSANIYTFYKDYNGNIIYVEPQVVAAANVDYIYVIDVIAKAAGKNADGTDLFGTGATTYAAQAQAKVLDLKTGEVKIVDLAIGNDANGNTVFMAPGGAPTSTKVASFTTLKDNTKDNTYAHRVDNGNLFTYTVEDGAYAISLSPIAPKTMTVATKGNAKVDVDGAVAYTTSKTEVTEVVYTRGSDGKPTGATVNTATGLANIAKGTYTGIVTVADGYVTKVLAVKAKAAATATETYAVYVGEGETAFDAASNKNIYYYEFSVNGEIKNLADDDGKYNGTNAWVEGDVYAIEYSTAKGTVTGKAKAPTATGAKVTKLQDEYVVFSGDTTAYKLAKNFVAINAKTYAPVSLTVSETNTVSYFLNSDKQVVFALVTVG